MRHRADGDVESLALDAAHRVALATPTAEGRLEWRRRGLDLASSGEDAIARRGRASWLNNLAWTHHDAGEFEFASRLFVDAYGERVSTATPSTSAIQLERWLKAREDGSLGRHGDALAVLAALDPTDAYVVEEIGHNARGGRMS